MDIDIKSWLFNILSAIDEIESFFADTDIDLPSYQSDIRTKRAVERDLEIIGEAMSRILDRTDSITLSNARKIVDTRNRIIHGYDAVSDETILGIVITHIPTLKAEINSLLNSN